MEIQNIRQEQAACTLHRAGNAVEQGLLPDDAFHILVGLYAIDDGTGHIKSISERFISTFLCRSGSRTRIPLAKDGLPVGIEAVGKALVTLCEKGWITLGIHEGREHVYDIILPYGLCGNCPTKRVVLEQ